MRYSNGKKLNLSQLNIWVCYTYMIEQCQTSLEPKFDKCLFVGYPKDSYGCYFCNALEQKLFVLRNAIFLETGFILERGNGTKIEPEEVPVTQTDKD